MKRSIEVYNKIPEASSFKVAPFDNKKKHTRPHRHNNYFEIIYLSSCKGNLFLQYTSLLSNPDIGHRTIGSYADALHTSSQNLINDVMSRESTTPPWKYL